MNQFVKQNGDTDWFVKHDKVGESYGCNIPEAWNLSEAKAPAQSCNEGIWYFPAGNNSHAVQQFAGEETLYSDSHARLDRASFRLELPGFASNEPSDCEGEDR